MMSVRANPRFASHGHRPVPASALPKGIAIAAMFAAGPVSGQSPDDIQVRLLKDNCSQLISGSQDFLDHAGPQLLGLCLPIVAFPPGGGGGGGQTGNAASGGGAAGAQAQFAILAHRLAKARGKNDEKQPAGAGAGDEAVMNLAGGLNLFVSGQFEAVDRKQTPFETGYHSNIQGVTGGADLRMSDWLLGGLAVNYNHADSNFASLGGFQTDTFGPMLYASILPLENAFADIMLEYKHQWRDRSRYSSFSDLTNNKSAAGLLSSDYGSDRLGANAVFGYDYSLGPVSVGPRFGFSYSRMNIDSYTETGNTGLELRFLRDRITSLQSSVGLQITAAVSTGIGVVTPQLNADWTHEYRNDQREISAQFAQDGRAAPTIFQFQNDKPDRDFFHLGTGVGLLLPNGVQPYLNFEALLGNRFFSNFAGTVGVRIEL